MKPSALLALAFLTACSSSNFSVDLPDDTLEVSPSEDSIGNSEVLSADGGIPDSAPDSASDSTPSTDSQPPSNDSQTLPDTADTADTTPPTPTACVLPTGSVATAAKVHPTSLAKNAIDGNVATWWNAGDSTGSITITFPKPIVFDRVQVMADANPSQDEKYTIEEVSYTRSVPLVTASLEAFSVPRRERSSITISISTLGAPSSLVSIAEVLVFDSSCP